MAMRKLLTVEDIIKLGVGCRTTIWKMVKQGRMPSSVKIGTHASARIFWYEDEIEEWFNNLPRTRRKSLND